MAFEPPGDDNEHFSKFNEAWLKMKRIHRLQDEINSCMVNPIEFNLDYNCFNYQVILRNCASLIAECWGKLNDETRKDAQKFKDAIEKTITKYPIHNQVKDVSSNKLNLKYDQRVWNVLYIWLYNYNLKCRELLSAAGYDSPDRDYDDDGL